MSRLATHGRFAAVFACSTQYFAPPDTLADWSSHSAQVARILEDVTLERI
jgi:hypothetical protein